MCCLGSAHVADRGGTAVICSRMTRAFSPLLHANSTSSSAPLVSCVRGDARRRAGQGGIDAGRKQKPARLVSRGRRCAGVGPANRRTRETTCALDWSASTRNSSCCAGYWRWHVSRAPVSCNRYRCVKCDAQHTASRGVDAHTTLHRARFDLAQPLGSAAQREVTQKTVLSFCGAESNSTRRFAAALKGLIYLRRRTA